MNRFQTTPRGLTIRLKVVPGASRDAIAGWLGDRLKIRVSAAPEHGKANEAVRRLLAKTLHIDRRRIRLTAGATSPEKTVEIDGLSETDLAARLPQ